MKYPSLIWKSCRLLLVVTNGKLAGWRSTKKMLPMPGDVEIQPVSENNAGLLEPSIISRCGEGLSLP